MTYPTVSDQMLSTRSPSVSNESVTASLPSLPLRFTAMGIDFGLKRTGVAVGSSQMQLAQPLTIVTAKDHATRFVALQKLINEWGVTVVVVGVPTHADGSPTQMTFNCRRFAQRLLKINPRLTIVLEDENYTSVLSQDDSEAAALILQQFFDRNSLAQLLLHQSAQQPLEQVAKNLAATKIIPAVDIPTVDRLARTTQSDAGSRPSSMISNTP